MLQKSNLNSSSGLKVETKCTSQKKKKKNATFQLMLPFFIKDSLCCATEVKMKMLLRSQNSAGKGKVSYYMYIILCKEPRPVSPCQLMLLLTNTTLQLFLNDITSLIFVALTGGRVFAFRHRQGSRFDNTNLLSGFSSGTNTVQGCLLVIQSILLRYKHFRQQTGSGGLQCPGKSFNEDMVSRESYG